MKTIIVFLFLLIGVGCTHKTYENKVAEEFPDSTIYNLHTQNKMNFIVVDKDNKVWHVECDGLGVRVSYTQFIFQNK